MRHWRQLQPRSFAHKLCIIVSFRFTRLSLSAVILWSVLPIAPPNCCRLSDVTGLLVRAYAHDVSHFTSACILTVRRVE
ncbi:hypothetical protein EDC04DRAFT_1414850 [Pisolithus marmoratus]|nr:hypothetical protein EDC04DRAFT_1414850 [Pisolithus marmoratus]